MTDFDPYESCMLCPHRCGVDRRAGRRGLCGETAELRVAAAGLHFGEEPPLTGTGGSGTIFITGCPMQCPFCQNHQVSRGGRGGPVDVDAFTAICLALTDAGATNINLVTPSHMVPTLKDFMAAARAAGVGLPVAWNSSGWESIEAVELAAGFTDIWLPDLKTLDAQAAGEVYGIPEYPEHAARAILAMAEVGAPVLDDSGVMRRGLMVRHLVIPGRIESTRGVLEWFARHLRGRAWLSLMTQYTPVRIPGERRRIPDRQLKSAEYESVLGFLDEYGIDDGFVQDLVPGDEWLPDFGRPNPFGSELSRILWRPDDPPVRDR